MKMNDVFNEVKAELAAERKEAAKEILKERLREVQEIKRAADIAEEQLNKLLVMDIENVVCL